jgi:RHS repeat-associated protein
VADHLTSLTDPNTNVTTYAYDDFDNLRQEVSPVSGTTTYSHDPAGNLVGKTDANGAVTTITYDALDRPLALAATRSSSTDNVIWTYDDATSGHYGIGRLASMTDPTGSTSYTYEHRGLLTGETRMILTYAYTLAYRYDNNGNRNSVTYPDGKVVSYTFDFADRPYSVKNGSPTLVSAATYQPFGPIASVSFGNGAAQTLTYQAFRYLPAENKLVNSSSVKLADYNYAEDNNGNITQIHDALNAGYNRDFAYDDIDRISLANSGASLWGTSSSNLYTYDNIGDITGLQLGTGRVASFSYVGTTSKLSSVTENGTQRSVAYDAAGNETSVGSATYAYSPQNLLAIGDGLSYLYDANAIRRVTTTSTGKRFSFESPELATLSESAVAASGKPAIAYDYIWLSDRPVAQIDSSGTHYTFADHLGTPELQMDNSANVTWQAEYEPYGKVWALRAGDVHQPIRLPGQVAEQFDSGANGATERSYNNFRWYRPGWGRYSQTDTIGLAAGINVYGYAANDPGVVTDPFGLCKIFLRFAVNYEVYKAFNHAFIETVNPNGERNFYRAGPERLSPFDWGNIIVNSGDEFSSTNIAKDISNYRGEKKKESYTLLFQPASANESCACYERAFSAALNQIQNQKIPYDPFGFNSNYSAYRAAHLGGLSPPPPPGYTPGWELWPNLPSPPSPHDYR